MRTRFYIVIVLIVAAIHAVGCSSMSPSYRLEFDQDVTLLLENNQEKPVKRGEAVEAPIAPMTITRANHKSVVLLPVVPNEGNFRIRLPKESPADAATSVQDLKMADEQQRELLGREANTIAKSVVEIQTLLTEKRADEALIKIQLMRERYPKFSYLTFLEAGCFLVKDDLDKARALVESALKEFPDDLSGRQFLESLEKPLVNEQAATQTGGGNER